MLEVQYIRWCKNNAEQRRSFKHESKEKVSVMRSIQNELNSARQAYRLTPGLVNNFNFVSVC